MLTYQSFLSSVVRYFQMENEGMGPLGAPPQVPLDLKNGQNSGKLAKLLSFLPCRTLEVH